MSLEHAPGAKPLVCIGIYGHPLNTGTSSVYTDTFYGLLSVHINEA